VHVRGCVLAACLNKLVRRQRPVAKLVEYLQKEKDIQSKHRDFRKEQEAIKEQKRLDALPKAEKRRELARIQREKRLAAEASVAQETVENPMTGSSSRNSGADTDTMSTPKKNPSGLSVQIPGDEDGMEGEGTSTPNYESKKQRSKREKKEAKQRAREAKKRAKEEKKLRKISGQSGDSEGSRPAAPPVAARPGGIEVEHAGTLGQDSHVAALSLLAGDTSEQLAQLENLGSLEALSNTDGGDVV
jgi:hypothetical protein